MREKIVINLNHNLASKFQSFIIKNILSKKIDFTFIEPSKSFLMKFSFIIPLYITSKHPRRNNQDIAFYIFTGSRLEHQIENLNEYIKKFDDINLFQKASTIITGKGFGYLDDQDFIEIFNSTHQNVIIILYSEKYFKYRHSGIVLEAIASGTHILLQESELSKHYVSRNFNVETFKNPTELSNLIEKIII
jgi:hypothetical protein